MVYGGEEYQLHSSVLHIGNSANSGHYVTYYFNNKSVYKFDDHAGGRPAGYYSVIADAYDKVEGTEYIFLYKKKDTVENEVAELQVLDSDNLQPTAVTSPPREGEQQTKIQQPASVGEEINNVQSLMVTSPPRSTAQLSQKETIELDTQSQPKTPGKPIDYETLQPAKIVVEEIDSPTRNGNQPMSNGTPIGTKTPSSSQSIQLDPEMIINMRDQLNQIYLAVTTPTNSQNSNQSMSPASNASQSPRIHGIQRRLAFSEIPGNEKNLSVIQEETSSFIADIDSRVDEPLETVDSRIEEPSKVAFYEGNHPQIYFVGAPNCCEWRKDGLITIFVLIENTQALMFRVDVDTELR